MSHFNFSDTYILEDEYVSLRPLEEDDFNHLKSFAIKEPDIWSFSLTPVSGEDNMKKYITDALDARKNEKEYPFIVFDKVKQQYAGCTRFYDIQLFHKTVQLGYTWYGKAFQGTGLNKHCKFLLLAFAFEKMQLERVEFRADNDNIKSIAAMKSIGCTVEGVLRKNLVLYSGKRRDSIVLSILKEEWEKDIKHRLKQRLNLTA